MFALDLLGLGADGPCWPASVSALRSCRVREPAVPGKSLFVVVGSLSVFWQILIYSYVLKGGGIHP